MSSEFMQPAPRWIQLPGDPPLLRKWLYEQAAASAPFDAEDDR